MSLLTDSVTACFIQGNTPTLVHQQTVRTVEGTQVFLDAALTAGIVTSVMANTASASVYDSLSAPHSGRVVANNSGAARARANVMAVTEGDIFTCFCRLKVISGAGPRIQLSNSTGSSTSQSDFVQLVEGFQVAVVTAQGTVGQYNCAVGIYSPAAGSFELDFFVVKGAVATTTMRYQMLLGNFQRQCGVGILPSKVLFSGASWLAQQSQDISFEQITGATPAAQGWVTTGTAGGSVTASGQTLTLTGTASYANLNLPSYYQTMVLDAIVKVANTNKLNIVVRSAGPTVERQFTIDSLLNTITETVAGTTYTPGNGFDASLEFRVRLFVDRYNKLIHLDLLYYNSAGADNPLKQVRYEIASATSANEITNVRFLTDAAGVGDATVRVAWWAAPGMAGMGSSIIAGSGASGSEYSPFPRFKGTEIIQNSPGYWIDRATGLHRKFLNWGVASGGSTRCAADIASILRFKPECIITDMGFTNDIQDVVADATTKANAIVIILACQAAAVPLVVMQCLPRDAFNSTARTRCDATNLWLEDQAKFYGFGVAAVNLPFRSPADATKINPAYSDDGTHPNPIGHRFLAQMILAGTARIFV